MPDSSITREMSYDSSDSSFLLTVPEAARILRISETTTWRRVRDGRLRSVIVGVRCRRIPMEAIRELLKAGS